MQAWVRFVISHIYLKSAKMKCLVGELTQQRRVSAGFTQGLVHRVVHKHLKLALGSLFGSLHALYECDGHKYMQAKHAYA